MTAPGLITPVLGEVLESASNARASRLHVALPGTVIAYNPEKNLADIELQVKDAFDDDDDEVLVQPYPPLIGVPVVFPRAKNAFFAWAVEPGDRVAVLFASQAIDQWLATGKVSAPGDLRRHDLAHAFCVPGLYPMIEPVPVGDRQAAGAALGIPGGLQIRFSATEIKLGKNASDAVSLASKVDAELQKIKVTLDSLTGGSEPPAEFTVPYVRAGVGSTKVRSE